MKVSQNYLLNKQYKHSLKLLKKEINSVHSATLKELYTQKYKPDVLYQGVTKIKNKNSQEAVRVFIEGFDEGKDYIKKRIYKLRTQDKQELLGHKSFCIESKPDKPNHYNFTQGYIESNHNKEYAGTQIRLLQFACELARKYHVNKIPLYSLKAPIQFHTMMGFRPDAQYTFKVKNLEDLHNAVDNIKFMFPANLMDCFKFILSKNEKNEYFADFNRSLYCGMMQDVRERQAHCNKKIIKTDYKDLNIVDMSLSGKELQKWYERMKGFEMLPEDECLTKRNISMVERLYNWLYSI